MSEPADATATVTVHAHGELTGRLGRSRGGTAVTIVPGTTIRELMAQLDVPTGEVWVCSRNGVLAKLDDALADGDVVEAFSPVAGGSL